MRRNAALPLRPSLALLALAVSLTCGPRDEPAPETALSAHKPDVILITLDTTRTERLGCYGNPIETSPNLDALANDGVRFDLAIAQAAVTPVSHASILTGLNPYHHGVRVMYAASGYELPASVPTLATILHDAGWATGAFLSAFPVSEYYGFDRGFDHFDSGIADSAGKAFQRDEATGRASWDLHANQRRSDATVDVALRWIERQTGPLLAWVHLWDPHDPWILPPEDVLARFGAVASADIAHSEEVYAAEIFHMDAQIGRLLARLREIDRYDDGIVVVVADHGQGLSDGLERHGWWRHRLLYQEQIRVPMIVRLPGERSGGVVSDLVRTVDLLPTVLEFIGFEPPRSIDGQSLLGPIRGVTEPPRLAYAEQLNRWDLNARMAQARPEDDLLYCLMDRAWKLIYRPHRPERSELYHLDSDPLEMRNRYSEEPDQAKRLVAKLEALDAFVDEPFPAQGAGVGPDDDTLRRLEALGYVGGGSSDATP